MTVFSWIKLFSLGVAEKELTVSACEMLFLQLFWRQRAPITFIWKPYIYIYMYIYVCVRDRINGSYFKQWLWSGLMNLVRLLFWISYWWFYFLLLLTSPRVVEQLEWPISFPTHKRFWSKYITGHKISFEIQGIFPSSPNYEIMDPCLFEKEKKHLLVLSFRRRTVQKK